MLMCAFFSLHGVLQRQSIRISKHGSFRSVASSNFSGERGLQGTVRPFVFVHAPLPHFASTCLIVVISSESRDFSLSQTARVKIGPGHPSSLFLVIKSSARFLGGGNFIKSMKDTAHCAGAHAPAFHASLTSAASGIFVSFL
jgi:hypothetical protein